MKGEEPYVISSPISIHIWIPLLLPGERLNNTVQDIPGENIWHSPWVVCDYAEINSGNCELRRLFIITLLSLLHLLLHLPGTFLLVSRSGTI